MQGLSFLLPSFVREPDRTNITNPAFYRKPPKAPVQKIRTVHFCEWEIFHSFVDQCSDSRSLSGSCRKNSAIPLKKVLLISFLILAADQALKFWVKTHMSLGEAISITPWFDLHFVENPGMAFGMEFGGGAGKLLLTLFRIVISGLLLVWIVNLTRRRASAMLVVPLTLIFAGAVGNIIDSMFYGLVFDDPTWGTATFLPQGGGYAPFLHGKVVDMFFFHFWQGDLPAWLPIWGGKPFVFFPAVFNIADAAVSVGIVWLILFQKKAFGHKDAYQKSDRYVGHF